ncbi:MAG TPA: MMPL family transporter [Candidatus Bathyarchaeia archaeon]|nr:MMPL family transporter [Candidatus Bathyarchaeia archaeon]
MPKSFFDSLNAFIHKRYRWVIISWAVVVLLSLILIPSFFSAVSYDIVGSVKPPANSESDKTLKIMDAQFPELSNASQDILSVVVQGTSAYSDSLKGAILKLNSTISKDKDVNNFTGVTSLYSVEANLLNDSLSEIINQTASLQSNITTINSGVYALQDNLTTLSTGIFQLQNGINQTAQLVFGVPAAFVGVWQGVVQELNAQGITNPNLYTVNAQANSTVFNVTSNFGGNVESLGYYTAFFDAWNASYTTLSNGTSISDREAFAIGQAVSSFLSNPQLNSQTRQTIGLVASNLTVSNWNQLSAIENLTISTMASIIPSNLSSSLGVSATSIINELYSFGPSPSNASIANYAITLIETYYSNQTIPDVGFSVSDLIRASYNLGRSPSNSQTWNLSCEFISNATQNAFSDSPLFKVNSTSLSYLLQSLSRKATIADIQNAVDNEISTQSYANYPFALLTSLTKNFVNSNNDTMLIVLNFASSPEADTVTHIRTDIDTIGLQDFGQVYVTGGPAVSLDLRNTILPILDITLLPGIILSIIIVGLLLFSLAAAFIPILMGGCSIVVSLAVIYLGIVKVGHTSLSFLTPALTLLLLLGLAVDYAVLQIKRTKEERLQCKSIKESVGISIKWAGQAVLTAGTTVIAAYVVLVLANVPLFSTVGLSIAIGVSVLLVASITLLPALEIALGDRLFWPSLNKRFMRNSKHKGILKRMVEGTLKRRVLIVVAIGLVSLGAIFVTYNTPFNNDVMKVIPNFSSNEGLNVISDNFGTGTVYPTYITVTMPTQITYGDNQFNQTLLNQIEQITATAANSEGITSVVSPTRPYGRSFNYSNIENMSYALRLQYENQMFAAIGKDNKTALVTVGLSESIFSQDAINSLSQMEKNINNLPLISGTIIHFGGQAQSTSDTVSFMDAIIPEITAILAATICIILFFQLRSVLMPLYLVAAILCSVILSLAVTSLIFYKGLNLPIVVYVPLFIVVTTMGVGVDYGVFFANRVREEAINGKTDGEAIVAAIDKIWVTILGLGLVLAAVFACLLIPGIGIFNELSLAIAIAVLLAITAGILFFVPALMELTPKHNWWPRKRPGVNNKKTIKGQGAKDEL